jgi:cytochrome bd-type quinol oxidase subunit 2
MDKTKQANEATRLFDDGHAISTSSNNVMEKNKGYKTACRVLVAAILFVVVLTAGGTAFLTDTSDGSVSGGIRSSTRASTLTDVSLMLSSDSSNGSCLVAGGIFSGISADSGDNPFLKHATNLIIWTNIVGQNLSILVVGRNVYPRVIPPTMMEVGITLMHNMSIRQHNRTRVDHHVNCLKNNTKVSTRNRRTTLSSGQCLMKEKEKEVKFLSNDV